MNPGKHQRSRQRRQDLCRKVHDPAQSFVLRSYTMHELRNQHVFLVCFSVRSKQLLHFARSQDQNREHRNIQQNNFVEIQNHSPLLTIVNAILCIIISLR